MLGLTLFGLVIGVIVGVRELTTLTEALQIRAVERNSYRQGSAKEYVARVRNSRAV